VASGAADACGIGPMLAAASTDRWIGASAAAGATAGWGDDAAESTALPR
jgi:hypothetical protein